MCGLAGFEALDGEDVMEIAEEGGLEEPSEEGGVGGIMSSKGERISSSAKFWRCC